MAYKRIKGGEKNLKSGVRWTKDEIVLVYKLYKKLNGVGLHEHNPEIQKLAGILGRTVRSTEAQTLMFRNLEREGKYSHGNMNKLSKQVWNEFESGDHSGEADILNTTNTSENLFASNSFIEQNTDNELKYNEWNSLLIEHFFNEKYAFQEIGCLPVSDELFQEITEFEFTVEDFISSISKEIGSKTFFVKLENLYEISLPKRIQGRSIRKAVPSYFGFLIFIIFSLSEDEGEGLTASNVYDRINNFGKQVLNKKWNNLNSALARNLLEPIWSNLQDWSCKFKKGSLGEFKTHNPDNSQRKYVSRIERHSLFNSRQFAKIIDLLIDDGYIPGQVITLNEWTEFFNKHTDSIRKANTILNYLNEKGPLQTSVVKFLNNCCNQLFTTEVASSQDAKFRSTTLRLKLCIDRLPRWHDEPISNYHFRIVDENLQEPILLDNQNVNLISPGLSDKITTEINFNEGQLFKTVDNRYATSKKIFWLSKNHELNEWIESDSPSNDSTFIMVIEEDVLISSGINEEINFSKYSFQNTNHVALKFNNLSHEHFDEVYKLYNPYTKIEGKIELVSAFTSDRRRCIYSEFYPLFKYIGPTVEPIIYAIDPVSKEVLCCLNKAPKTENMFTLPADFSYEGNFQIKESVGIIKSRYNYYFGDLSKQPSNISFTYLKDVDGKNLDSKTRGVDDVLDIPSDFYKKFDVPIFNQWHKTLFRLFKSNKTGTSNLRSTEIELLSKGDLLLQFVAQNNNISTYEFPKLICELDPEVSKKYSKRIMDYWRQLGYISFQDYGENVKVNPSAILFLRAPTGLTGYLTGYRSPDFINQLSTECKKLSIILCKEEHANYKSDLYPSKITLYSKNGELEKFYNLRDTLNIDFVNDIQNPLNPKYVVYQLACLFRQRSVKEFVNQLKTFESYVTDHRRKRVYDITKLKWVDSNVDVEEVPDMTVVRYEGFRDNSMTHILRANGGSIILNELYVAIFSTLESDVIFKTKLKGKGEFDLLVPFFLGLPFWIERGLLLINAQIPERYEIKDRLFRKYKSIPNTIINVIGEKLNQNIVEI